MGRSWNGQFAKTQEMEGINKWPSLVTVISSVERSVLFNLFMHDLENGFNNKVTKVTDDAQLFKIFRMSTAW